jgi:hypothetical protein
MERSIREQGEHWILIETQGWETITRPGHEWTVQSKVSLVNAPVIFDIMLTPRHQVRAFPMVCSIGPVPNRLRQIGCETSQEMVFMGGQCCEHQEIGPSGRGSPWNLRQFSWWSGITSRNGLESPIEEQKPKPNLTQFDSCSPCDLWERQSCSQKTPWGYWDLSG